MKVKLWFVYENVTNKDKLSSLTKKVIELINYIEKTYDKKNFDLRSIEYTRFLSEYKKELCIRKNDLPVVIMNENIIFKGKLPSVHELKKEIEKLRGE